MPLHTRSFTHRHFYIQTLLHTGAFQHRCFYTQTLFHTDTFTHRRFYIQTLLDTNAFTHRRCYTQTLSQPNVLDTNALTHTYTQTHVDVVAIVAVTTSASKGTNEKRMQNIMNEKETLSSGCTQSGFEALVAAHTFSADEKHTWLVVSNPLKNYESQLPIYGKIIRMFQTTNQKPTKNSKKVGFESQSQTQTISNTTSSDIDNKLTKIITMCCTLCLEGHLI